MDITFQKVAGKVCALANVPLDHLSISSLLMESWGIFDQDEYVNKDAFVQLCISVDRLQKEMTRLLALAKAADLPISDTRSDKLTITYADMHRFIAGIWINRYADDAPASCAGEVADDPRQYDNTAAYHTKVDLRTCHVHRVGRLATHIAVTFYWDDSETTAVVCADEIFDKLAAAGDIEEYKEGTDEQ